MSEQRERGHYPTRHDRKMKELIMWKKNDKFRFPRLKVTFNKWLFTTESHRFTSREIGIAEVVLIGRARVHGSDPR